MTRVPAGALRHRLVLEEAVRTPDGGGGVTVAWSPVAMLWAGIESGSGSEGYAADGLRGEASHRITVRRRGGIMPAMRFRLGIRIFSILAILGRDDGSGFLTILAVERNL